MTSKHPEFPSIPIFVIEFVRTCNDLFYFLPISSICVWSFKLRPVWSWVYTNSCWHVLLTVEREHAERWHRYKQTALIIQSYFLLLRFNCCGVWCAVFSAQSVVGESECCLIRSLCSKSIIKHFMNDFEFRVNKEQLNANQEGWFEEVRFRKFWEHFPEVFVQQWNIIGKSDKMFKKL